MKFEIFKSGTWYTIQTSDSSWGISRYFIGYSKREIVRLLKQIAREKFGVKRISAEIFEI